MSDKDKSKYAELAVEIIQSDLPLVDAIVTVLEVVVAEQKAKAVETILDIDYPTAFHKEMRDWILEALEEQKGDSNEKD